MATLLLAVIYICFIGLGLPDSLFGTAWPAIYTEFECSLSLGVLVSMTCTVFSTLSGLFSARIINKFGTPIVTAVSTVLTAAALLGLSFSQNLLWLILLSVPLGIGGGAIDSGLNNYVALHYSASQMSFLHCFYGIGVSLSPYLMSLALSKTGWRSGYRLAFFFQIVISLIAFLALPLWKRVRTENAKEEDFTPVTLSFGEMLKNKKILLFCAILTATCGIECTAGVWGSTFFVESRGFSPDKAALLLTFYYGGMALGRFFSGILSKKFSSLTIILMGESLLLCALVLMALPLPSYLAAASLFFIGLGNGPLYPNVMHMTPLSFGKACSQSVIGLEMAFAYSGILLIPNFFGLLAGMITPSILPFYLLILYAVLILSTLTLKKKGKSRL